MRIFTCSHCGNIVFFENVRCTHCGYALAYFPEHGVVTAIEPVDVTRDVTRDVTPAEDEPLLYRALSNQIAGRYRLCANSAAYGVCNSAVAVADEEQLCHACRLNDELADLSEPSALASWQALERWKRRLLFSLRQLGLPIETRKERPEDGLMFSFLRDSADGSSKVFTGHSDGLITINIAEADDPFREKLRKQLGEGYRTVLGHFRHEIGHYYWDRLIKDSPWLPAYRKLFGDERANYARAVQRHYDKGAPANWAHHYVSAYATMHPWEDWAESWAHYMHIVDTLDTAHSHGVMLRAKPDGRSSSVLAMSARALDFDNFDDLFAGWVPVTVTLNSLNRSMGLIDPYPFVLCAEVVEKLRFVHEVVRHWNSAQALRRTVIARWLGEQEDAAAVRDTPSHAPNVLPAHGSQPVPAIEATQPPNLRCTRSRVSRIAAYCERPRRARTSRSNMRRAAAP